MYGDIHIDTPVPVLSGAVLFHLISRNDVISPTLGNSRVSPGSRRGLEGFSEIVASGVSLHQAQLESSSIPGRRGSKVVCLQFQGLRVGLATVLRLGI